MNSMSNFVPNELITSDYQEPTWMNCSIKNVICCHKQFSIYLAVQHYEQPFFCLKI